MKANLLHSALLCLFIAASAMAQNTPHDLKQKAVNTLSSSVSKEQLQKETAFFGADSLLGFDLSSAIGEALLHYSTYSELKSHLYFLEANYVKTKFGVTQFPGEMDNRSYSPPPEVMSACSNVDFESGSFAGWTGKKGYNALSTNPLTVTSTGIFTTGLNANYRDCSYHTLVNTGTDYYGGFPMLNPGGGSYSVRLGGENANVFDGTDCVGPYVCHSPAPGPATYCGGESLEQTFTVGATNTLFTFSYAAVLNDGGHTPGHQPYFSIQVFNSSGVAIGCFSQRVELVSGVVPPGGVLSANGNCWFPSTMTDYKVYYIPWKTNSYNLSAYVGQNVTVKFTASGCTEGDHFCYAYFDASCGPAEISTSNASPCTGSTVTLTAPATISGPYAWTGPGIVGSTTGSSVVVNAGGTYSVTVGSGPCSYSLSLPVTFAGSGTVSATAASPAICAGTSTTINASAASTYNWSANAGSATTSSVSVNPASTTTYTVSGTSTGGCPYSTTVTVNVNALPAASASSPGPLTCTTLTIPVTASSSTGTATYSWAGAGIVSGGTSATATVNTAGTYTVTVTDPATSCSNVSTVTVNSNTTQPGITPGSALALNCSATSGTVTASSGTAGATYSWAGAGITSGGSAATATVNAAGTYTVTVTDPSNGCTNTATVTVTSNTTAPDVTPGSAQTITCSVSSATVSASSSTAGATYNWSGAGITAGGTTSSPTVNAAGTYTVTVTDPANSCTATATVDVLNSGTLPDVSTGSALNLDCITTSGTIAASSTTPGATFSWTGSGIVSGGSAASAIVNASGTYTVTVTDPSTGCTSNATVMVNSNTALPDASPGTALTLNCSNSSGTIDVTSVTSGATFNWSGPGIASGGTTASPVVNAPGTYTVTVTDPANGCVNTATVPVANNTTPPDAVAGSPLTIDCTTTSGTISVTSVTPGATYNWAGAGIVSGAATSSATVNTAGTYTVTVTDPANTCTATATVVVTNTGALPNVTAGPSLTLTCVVNSGSISANSSTAGVTYSWTGAGIVSGGTTASPTVDSSGTYIVIVTDPSNGCTNTTNVSVTTNTTLPDAIAGSGPVLDCLVSSGAVNVSSVTPGATYSWSGAGIISGGGTSSATVNAAGTYTVIVTDPANGCTGSATVIATSNTVQPDVSAGAGLTLDCATASGVITASSATPGVNYSWSGPGIVSGGTTAAPLVSIAGIYTVTVTDPANGCVNTTTVNVGSNGTAPAITSGASNDSITCADPSSVLGVTSSSGNSIYSWSGPGGFTSGAQNPNISVPGDYIVTVLDTTNGCSSTDTVTVVQGVDPVAGFTPSVVSGDAPLVVDFTNTSSAGFSGYSWTFGDLNTSSQTNPQNTYTAPGTYVVTLIGLNGGCNDTATAIIDVKPLSSIFIPNVFTPDDDGNNELFTVTAEGYKEIRFVIYDRWGLKLWEMSAADKIWWNGRTTAGVPCSDGTYYYILYGEDHSGKKLEQPGFLTLLRGGR
ncbi:MAG: hypothetical protein JWO44_1092 [Bacteroidetes bacterium]|nr:hypothetical protein [Bacteroidota bacterium]